MYEVGALVDAFSGDVPGCGFVFAPVNGLDEAPADKGDMYVLSLCDAEIQDYYSVVSFLGKVPQTVSEFVVVVAAAADNVEKVVVGLVYAFVVKLILKVVDQESNVAFVMDVNHL